MHEVFETEAFAGLYDFPISTSTLNSVSSSEKSQMIPFNCSGQYFYWRFWSCNREWIRNWLHNKKRLDSSNNFRIQGIFILGFRRLSNTELRTKAPMLKNSLSLFSKHSWLWKMQLILVKINHSSYFIELSSPIEWVIDEVGKFFFFDESRVNSPELIWKIGTSESKTGGFQSSELMIFVFDCRISAAG